MSPRSFLVTSKPLPYHLVLAPISSDAPAPKESPIDHVLIVDVSGSMGMELPDLADQIANKLPTMIAPGHTLSLIRYSGRGQCETVFRGRKISGEIGSFAQVADAIRRALRPVGMTAFVDPFREARKVVTELRAAHSHHEVHVYMQTDGCETEGYTQAEILAAAADLAPLVSSFTAFEYGAYADRRLLASIAARMGGEHVHCRSFVEYEPAVSSRMSRRGGAGKKREIRIEGTMLGAEPFVFSIAEGAITIYGVESGKVSVPETVTEIAYLSASTVGKQVEGGLAAVAARAAGARKVKQEDSDVLALAYAALAVLVQRQDMDEVFGFLGALGDTHLAALAENAFTKPEFDAVVAAARSAASGVGRFVHGYDPHRVPRYDAWTVLQTLFTLAEDPDTRLVMDDPAQPFVYARIGRAKDDGDLLREEDMAMICTAFDQIPEVAEYRAALAAGLGKLPSPTSAKVKAGEKLVDLLDGWLATMPTTNTAIDFHKAFGAAREEGTDHFTMRVSSAVVEAIARAKPRAKFVEQKPVGGYPVDGLVFAKERANVSVRVKLSGLVDASGALPEEDWAKALKPAIKGELAAMETTTYRNYAVIRDGMLNVERLPVRLGPKAWEKLRGEGLVSGDHHPGVVTLNLSKIPVINRAMATSVKAAEVMAAEYEATRLGAALKVVDAYRDLWPGSPGYVARFGADVAGWLNDLGIRDSGFSPNGPKTKARDIAYHARVMSIGIAGLSSLPTMDKLRERRAAITDWSKPVKDGGKGCKGKEPTLTPGMALMDPTLIEIEAYIAQHKVNLDAFNAPPAPPSDAKAVATQAQDAAVLGTFKAWLDQRGADLGKRKRDLDRAQSGRVFVMVAGGVRPSDLKAGETEVAFSVEGVPQKGKIEAVLKPVAA